MTPRAVEAYLTTLAGRLAGELGDRLLGAYAVGSVALGGYRDGRSDVDVLAIVDGPLGRDRALRLAEACSHRALACPGRKLELVVMSAAEAAAASAEPRFELNLNSGNGIDDHVGLDPGAEPSFWFVLDLALAREHGIALAGPSPEELIARPDASLVSAAHADAVAWYARNEPGPGAVVAACRAWHWHETGRFASKQETVRWARERAL